MLNFVKERRITAFLWVLTVLFMWQTRAIGGNQAEWLQRDYSITVQTLYWIYGSGLAALTGILIAEPHIRTELRAAGALPLMTFLATASAVFAVWQLEPNQAHRFAYAVPTLSTLILWIFALGVGAVLLALPESSTAATPRMRRYAWLIVASVGITLLTVHIGSTGHYNRLNDIYDEIWAASAMANYVQSGNFSPSLGGSPYGASDPLLSRWLQWNGVWAGWLGSTDFMTLRTFPTLGGLLLIAVMMLILWREPSISLLGRVWGLVFVLSLSVYARTSHNLRMDVGLGLYGALLLLFILEYFRDKQRGAVWATLAGLSLYLGMETIPTTALIVATLFGLLIVWRVWERPLKTIHWQHVVAYGVGCTIAIFGYVIVHFAPDFAESWANFQNARARYVLMGSVTSGTPLTALTQTHRFSFLMSPIEAIGVYAVLLGFLTLTDRLERGLLVVVGIGQLLIHGLLGGSFGYQMVFVPLVGYAAARALHGRLAVVLGICVLLPAMAAAPLHDMVTDWQLRLNERLIDELDLLTWRVADGATVIGDDLFWLTLHDQTQFYGHSALQHYKTGFGIDNDQEMMRQIAPDMVICRPEIDTQSWLCDLAAAYFNTQPEPFEITLGTFHIYLPEMNN